MCVGVVDFVYGVESGVCEVCVLFVDDELYLFV